jgi:asparagine synthase (glutamine-hydrolysing)
MCGICGFFHYASEKEVDKQSLQQMTRVLKHRGPDDEGFYLDRHIGFGHRRLSIIDISARGHQPMSNEDDTIWIVFNGEVYNFIELRDDLVKNGHIFKSDTDTEVIIHLYEDYGVRCLEKLRGMFAFAIWDKKNQQLFLARDRIGQKPLVYTLINGSLYFASEIKSLLQDQEIHKNKGIDLDALNHYFTYVYVPSPYTIFKGIKKLPPASYLLLKKNGDLSINKYWKVDYSQKWDASIEDYCERYMELLEESVKLRLRSDVPLGVMLSGGVDSSSIAFMADKISSNQIKTFCIGFPQNNKMDPEFIRAKKVAKSFNTEHHEVIFESQKTNLLPRILYFCDEPLNLFPIVYAYYLAQFMKQNATVILAGNGADEIFGGYTGYNKILQKEFISRSIAKFPIKGLSSLPLGGKLGEQIKRLLRTMNVSMEEKRGLNFKLSGDELAHKLYSEDFKSGLKVEIDQVLNSTFYESKAQNYMDGVLYTDLMTYHTHSHIILPDISGMANSLEIRSPFLDYKLVEFAASLPVKMKVPSMFKYHLNKYVMKRSMEGILPREILYGKKMGFGYAIDWIGWLRTIWQEKVRDILFNRTLPHTGLFNMDYIKKIVEEHIANRENHGSLIWGLIVFEIWYEIYMENRRPQDVSF